MPEVREGEVVDGRYRILHRLGTGGMADVWLAEDEHLQREVALKVLHRRFDQDQQFVARFQREAEAAAALSHPNIVSVYDRGEFEGVNYIAMQYVQGSTLKALIERGLTPEQAVPLVRQILEAARAAHRAGIVHRDLKPQNVIVDAEGKALVADFGIARAGVSEITQTGSVMGTPHYLSPEQAQGFEVTSVSDLYSIGVILYEALTGRVPFEGESAVAVAMKQVSQTPQLPSSHQPAGQPGARRGGDAGAGQGARRTLPERRRLHRRARPGAARAGGRRRHRGLRRAAAGGRRGGARRGATGRPQMALDRARGRRRGRHPDRPAADPRHRDRNPQRDRQAGRIRDLPARTAGLQGDRKDGRTTGAEEHRPRAGPAAGQRRRRMLLPHPVLPEADGRADGQRRPRQRQGAEHRRAAPGRSRRTARRSGIRRGGRTPRLRFGPGRPGDLLRTGRRRSGDPRLRSHPLRLQRPAAGQGAGAGRQAASRRGPGNPRASASSPWSKKKKRATRRRAK